MFYCPYCGTQLNVDETYCITCGKKMTKNIKNRVQFKRTFNRYWLIPLGVFILSLATMLTIFFIQDYQLSQAEKLFLEGEQHLYDSEYEVAITSFTEALSYKDNFSQAQTSLDFSKDALQIQSKLNGIPVLLEHHEYDKALELLDEFDKQLNHYQGTVVNDLISNLTDQREKINIKQIKHVLDNEPEIDDLKILLWEVDSLKNIEAEKITETIRQEIIDYTFFEASEQLNNNHFNDALLFVEDGLKYAPNSEKLTSLKQTIENEKVAFETAQMERIEQALNLAEEEQIYNKEDAVKLKHVSLDTDDQERLIIVGEIKSQATVPIQSVFIEYKIVDHEGSVLETNRVFAFPDRLYPKDLGKFEFTHYEIDRAPEDLSIEIEKITWYVD